MSDLQRALEEAGLESSNLIIGIDFTRSNETNGRRSFNNQSLHHISSARMNPYQSVISMLGATLEYFDDDKKIPTFGFGDTTTTDQSCFPFYADRECNGFNEVLLRYTELVPVITLSGPTNFAPIIRKAIDIVRVKKSYHILLIICDGAVTNEKDTANAIVEASNWPLSIVVVGVGDGPWHIMRRFDDEMHRSKVDNLQFVCFTEMAEKYGENYERLLIELGTMALQEVPEQFQYFRRNHLGGM